MNILGVLTNPIISVSVSLMLLMIIFYLYTHFRPEKKVELLRPRDSRGDILKIRRETDLGLTCYKHKGVVHRFVKAGRAWTFNIGGKMVTKFFGIEGTAYTAILKLSGRENRDDEGKEDIELKSFFDHMGNLRVSVSDFLKFIWGDEFYETVPQEQKDAIEKDVIGITIEPVKIDEKEWDLLTLTASDINDENDAHVLDKIAKAREPKGTQLFYQALIFLFIGFLSCYFFINQGFL